jgi:2-oxoglutarate ferredoxin oxidoreductase subunit alpha
VKALRAQGIKAGYFRPITLRPSRKKNCGRLLPRTVPRNLSSQNLPSDSWSVWSNRKSTEETAKIETLFMPGVGIIDSDIIDKVKSVL